MKMMKSKIYAAPAVLDHRKITFETTISAGGRWEYQLIDGCWVRVFVPN